MFTKYVIGFKYFDKEIEVFNNSRSIELDWARKKNDRVLFMTSSHSIIVIDMDSISYVNCLEHGYEWDTVKEKFILLE